jgi:TRAP-type C4-dicarboxylate transport system permease small subunit
MIRRRSAFVTNLERCLRLLLCVAIFMMMAITTVDVVSRYVLNAPLRGAFEIVTLLLATSAFLALPIVTRANEHITVDLILPLLRGALLPLRRLVVDALSAGILAVIALQMWRHAGLLASGGQVTGFLEWPLAPLVYLMSVLVGITVLIYVIMIAEQLRNFRAPRPDADESGSKATL